MEQKNEIYQNSLEQIEQLIHKYQKESNFEINVLIIPFFSLIIVEGDLETREGECFALHSIDGVIIPFNLKIEKNETRTFKQLVIEKVLDDSLGSIIIDSEKFSLNCIISSFEKDFSLNICCSVILEDFNVEDILKNYVHNCKKLLLTEISEQVYFNLVYIPLSRLYELSDKVEGTYSVYYNREEKLMKIQDGILLDGEISEIYAVKNPSLDIPLTRSNAYSATHPFQLPTYDSLSLTGEFFFENFLVKEFNPFTFPENEDDLEEEILPANYFEDI